LFIRGIFLETNAQKENYCENQDQGQNDDNQRKPFYLLFNMIHKSWFNWLLQVTPAIGIQFVLFSQKQVSEFPGRGIFPKRQVCISQQGVMAYLNP